MNKKLLQKMRASKLLIMEKKVDNASWHRDFAVN